MILMYVILMSTLDKTVPENIYGFMIGGFYAVNACTFGIITGGSINPARSLGPNIMNGKGTSYPLILAGLVVAPCLGIAYL